MTLHQQQTFRLYVTPDDLRQMATELEEHWKNVELGKSTIFKYITGEGGHVVLELAIDQGRMPK